CIKESQLFLYLLYLWLLFPSTLHASFIESTMGTAVVNDATAAYYNPAALTLLKNSQIITLGSFSNFHSQFTGQSIQSTTGFTQSGSTSDQTNYFLPSLYLGLPTAHNVTFGFALVSNYFNKNVEENSILRYAQSSSSTQNTDLIPAVGIKLNEAFSFGAGINFSYANLLLRPISGFPSLNIPDSQNRNECDGTGLGGDIGFLLKPTRSTTIGFNYRTAITYRLSGKSILEGNPRIISNNYSFNFWTPARSVFSINHFITPVLGLISTIQRIQWSIFNSINIHGIATQIGSQSVILNANVPYHLHDTWLFTLGSHYRVTPKWIIRLAGSYNQSAGNSHYQISNGDSIILGTSMGYEIYKNIIVDGSYAHAFMQNQNIHITSRPNIIIGKNKGAPDAISLKITFNL
ncbi:MAG: outer membrane protein transport protein, partial [Gammaproteobacteria bacterium]